MFTNGRLGFVVFVFLLASPTLAADLLGTVRQNGQLRANVEVKLEGTGAAASPNPTRSNGSGSFAFSGIAPGKYKLSCGGKDILVDVRAGANSSDCHY